MATDADCAAGAYLDPATDICVLCEPGSARKECHDHDDTDHDRTDHYHVPGGEEQLVEFGAFDFTSAPAGGWALMSVEDFAVHGDKFVAAYNALQGVRVVEAFTSGNCCFAVKGGLKLTIGGTKYFYQFPAAKATGQLRCSPDEGFAKGEILQFFSAGTLAAGSTFGAQSGCSTSRNPAVFMRALPAARVARVTEFGLYDFMQVPAGGWQLMDVEALNRHGAELVGTYNARGGFAPVRAFKGGNCCLAVKGGAKLHIEGTKYGFAFPADASGTLRCSPAEGYTSLRYKFYKVEALAVGTVFGAKPACVTDRNPALFMKLPTVASAPAVDLVFGLYGATLTPAGGWSLMGVEDFQEHSEAFAEYYNANGGVSVIQEFETGNCCVAVKGGLKLFIVGSRYGFQFPAEHGTGILRCSPGGGYTDTKYQFYTLPALDKQAMAFDAKAGCATSRNPGIFMKEVAAADRQVQFAVYDYSMQPAGGWEAMDAQHFATYREEFLSHYNLNNGLGVIGGFESESCCFVLAGGEAALVIAGAPYGQAFPALSTTGGIRCNPTGGYGAHKKYQFYGSPRLKSANVISAGAGCAKSHNPAVFIRYHAVPTAAPTEAPTPPPPVHCGVSEWVQWTACSATCGAGWKQRERTVTTGDAHGGDVCPALSESVPCVVAECAVHCAVSDWAGWADCNADCGGGFKSRTRVVTVEPTEAGDSCPHLSATAECNTQPCSVHCLVDDWGGWTGCNADCGGGFKARQRAVLVHAAYEGDACPTTEETQACNTQSCPTSQDCAVGEWGEYGACNAACGAGYRTRTRPVIIEPAFGGDACPAAAESQECTLADCHAACVVGEWAAWGGCTATCGGGAETRTREVAPPLTPGTLETCPAAEESRPCNTGACPS
jgi:hypothetical protein